MMFADEYQFYHPIFIKIRLGISVRCNMADNYSQLSRFKPVDQMSIRSASEAWSHQSQATEMVWVYKKLILPMTKARSIA